MSHVVEARAGGNGDAIVVDGAAASRPGAVPDDRACRLLDAAEREHLRYAAKCSSGICGAAAPSHRPYVGPAVRSLLAQLERGSPA